MAQQVNNPTYINEDVGLVPGLFQWVKGSGIAASCGIGHMCGSDPVWLWLWHRPSATALIRPQAWGLTFAMGVALSKKKDQKQAKEK